MQYWKEKNLIDGVILPEIEMISEMQQMCHEFNRVADIAGEGLVLKDFIESHLSPNTIVERYEPF